MRYQNAECRGCLCEPPQSSQQDPDKSSDRHRLLRTLQLRYDYAQLIRVLQAYQYHKRWDSEPVAQQMQSRPF